MGGMYNGKDVITGLQDYELADSLCNPNLCEYSRPNKPSEQH